MRAAYALFLALTTAAAVVAQHGQRFEINPGTPEGLLLQKASQAATDDEKIAAFDAFIAAHPRHPGTVYAWNQVQPLHLKAGQFDKVITGAAAILAAEPDNSPAAYNGLQAAERKLDVAAIILWANRTVSAAKLAIASKKPNDENEAAVWAANVDFAQQVIARCEYSFYSSALKVTDPAGIAALYSGLMEMNSQSQYVPMAAPRYFVALLQQKDLPKAQAFAEAAADRGHANEDMLLFVADANLNASNFDKALTYAVRITSTLPAQAAPSGIAAADWDARKKTTLARAHWIAGVAAGNKSDWPASEQSMRAALPLIEGNAPLSDLLPGAYFYLGLANYSVSKGAKPDAARRAEAKKYFTLCAAIPSPFQAQAARNLTGISAGK
ncbi:MAG TPA: hypothetical protein VGK29_02040 [Paludibaculum sp.]|jgi:hypothetical protein